MWCGEETSRAAHKTPGPKSHARTVTDIQTCKSDNTRQDRLSLTGRRRETLSPAGRVHMHMHMQHVHVNVIAMGTMSC